MSLFERLNNLKKRGPGEERPAKTETSPVTLPGGRVINSPRGEYVYIEEVQEGSIPFPGYREPGNNLRLLRGIGPVTEEKLKHQGYSSIEQLKEHPRWRGHAELVQEFIEKAEVHELRRLGAGDWDLLSFFRPEEVIFLDIESTGLWASQPLFLIGVLYYKSGFLVVEQFFARHYGEEKAVLEAVNGLLKKFKVIVTYNGKCFDMPYITQRTVARGLYYSYRHYHVDLLYHARKHLRGILPDCRLMTLEEYLLDFRREGDIPGYLIPQTYHRFVQTGDVELVEPVIHHNKLDLLAMARVFHLVNPEYTAASGLTLQQTAAVKE